MYQQLCSWENLLLAYKLASKGKRGKPNVALFEHRLEDNLFQLQEELLTQTYSPQRYTSFYIHEPKKRLISAAPFRDRVVHHALCNLIETVFERSFIADSYANRKCKGMHLAIERVQKLARRYPYVLQCDIKQFFPSIDHMILKVILVKKIQDKDVIWLIDRILESGIDVLSEEYDMVYFPGDDISAIHRPRGLPIGNLTSQFWANCYLNAFDHFVKRELGCKAYVRYVDDAVFFGKDKEALWKWKESIRERLARLRLTIHPGTHPRPVNEGIPFLGFIIYPYKRRLKRRKGVYFVRRLRHLICDYHEGRIPLEMVAASVLGWVNHVRFGNTVGLRKSIFRGIIISPPGKRKEKNN